MTDFFERVAAQLAASERELTLAAPARRRRWTPRWLVGVLALCLVTPAVAATEPWHAAFDRAERSRALTQEDRIDMAADRSSIASAEIATALRARLEQSIPQMQPTQKQSPRWDGRRRAAPARPPSRLSRSSGPPAAGGKERSRATRPHD